MDPRFIANKLCVLLVTMVLVSLRAFADSDEQDFNQLLELLEAQTSLATRTRINADYVPGMVSILTGQELRQRGFATVWEALAYIPGVLRNIDASGKRSLIFRGVGKKTETSKIKILLNNVPVNASAAGSLGTVLDMPIVQVERIELIRGPGSAIHGEFALMGVLNVITAQSGNGFSIGGDSISGAQVHLQQGFGGPTDEVNGHFNLALYQGKGEDIEILQDATAPNISGYAPGPVNNERDGVSAFFNLDIYNYRLLLQLQQSNSGDHFGINNYLPPPISQTVSSENLISLTLERDFQLGEFLDLGLSLTHLRNHTEKNDQFLGVAPSFGGLASDDDIVSDVDLQEHRNSLAVNATYQRYAHKLFAELSFAEITIVRSNQFVNLDPVTLLPDTTMNAFPAPVSRDQDRRIYSMVLQDEYRLTDSTTLTAGLRHDEFNDELDYTSPRLAVVTLLDDRNIVKYQYAQAYRPPSLREAGGAIDTPLEPETITTNEFAYIFDSDDLLVKNTLYYSEIDDFIAFNSSAPFGYRNIDGARIFGYELEAKREIFDNLSVAGSLAVSETEDLTDGEEIFGASPGQLTLSAQYRSPGGTQINVQVNHSLAQRRESDDIRGDGAAMTQLDVTLLRRNFLGMQGLEAYAGVKNLFAENIRYLAPKDTYPDDYPVNQDAIFWVLLSYRPL